LSTIEFSPPFETTAIFKVQNSTRGYLILQSKYHAFPSTANGTASTRGNGWYLSMTRQGQLRGNSPQMTNECEWQLISAAVISNNQSISQPPQQVQQQLQLQQQAEKDSTVNPLLTAGSTTSTQHNNSNNNNNNIQGVELQSFVRDNNNNNNLSNASFQSMSMATSSSSSSQPTQASSSNHSYQIISTPSNEYPLAQIITRTPNNNNNNNNTHTTIPSQQQLIPAPFSQPPQQPQQQPPQPPQTTTTYHNFAGFPGYHAGKVALMQFFLTPSGYAFLSLPEHIRLLQLYQSNGLLAQLLHRPDWMYLVYRFIEYSSPKYTITVQPHLLEISKSSIAFGTTTTGATIGTSTVTASSASATESIVKQSISYDLLHIEDTPPPPTLPLPRINRKEETWITYQHIQQFFEEGYTILSQVIPASSPLLQNALKIVHYWQYRYLHQTPSPPTPSSSQSQQYYTPNPINGLRREKFQQIYFEGDIQQDIDILSLYYDTQQQSSSTHNNSLLPQLMYYLLGANEVIHPTVSQILGIYPSLEIAVESPVLYGNQWMIDGFTSDGNHSPYNLLVGIALTDVLEPDQVIIIIIIICYY
jgi:hypothetical protein